jgi:hypothetical protein
MLFAFWPVGLFLLIRRLMQEMTSGYQPDGSYMEAEWQGTDEKYRRDLENYRRMQGSTPVIRTPSTGNTKKRFPAAAVLTIVGALFLLVGTMNSIETIADWVRYGYLFTDDLLSSLFMGCGFGCGMIFAGRRLKRREQLLKRYTAIISNRSVISIDEIASIESISYKKACRDIKDLLATGIFPDAYIDHSRRLLIVTNKGLEENELYRKATEPAASAPATTFVEADETAYSEKDQYIRRIRQVNDEIADPVLSEKIDKIEHLTAKMFEAVEKDPAKRPQIETFLSYYLPTTLKILNAYRDFENQTAKGANITSAMHDIENIMDTLVAGFEKQLDLLFANDALDITTDISVLEGMLAKDGLTDDTLVTAK